MSVGEAALVDEWLKSNWCGSGYVNSECAKELFGSVQSNVEESDKNRLESTDVGSKVASDVGPWDSSELSRLLGSIGAIKGVAKDSMCDWVLEQRSKGTSAVQGSGVGEIFLNTGWVGDTDPSAWSRKGFVVGYGDGSAVSSAVEKVQSGRYAERKGRMGNTRDRKKMKVEGSFAVGFGVACEDLPSVECATRVPKGVKMLGRPTINVGEGMALLVFLARCPMSFRIAYFADSKIWYDWAMSCKKWLTEDPVGATVVGKLGKQFRCIKLLILLVVLLRTGPTAIGKVKSHVGIKGNERADELADVGRERAEASSDWEWLDLVDWGRVSEVVSMLADLREEVSASKVDGVMGDGKIIQVVGTTGHKNARKLRQAVFPFFKKVVVQAEREWQQALSSGEDVFSVIDKWYRVTSEHIFREAEVIMGSKRPGNGGGGQRQTKEFKEKEELVVKGKRAVAVCGKLVKSSHKIRAEDMVRLVEWAGDVEVPYGEYRVQCAIVRAQAALEGAIDELEVARKQDAREARRKGMYAATMGGSFRSLRLLANKGLDGGVEIEIEDFVAAHKVIHVLPESWVDEKWHLKSQEELWEAFGRPAGWRSEEADENLRRKYERGEYLKQLAGKRPLSRPGIDGIPFVVKSMLVAPEGEPGDLGAEGDRGDSCVDMVDVDLFFFEKFRHTKQPFSLWKQVVDFILRKGGKDDYKKVSSYRNISLAVVSRKVLGGIWWQRFVVWLRESGRLGRMQVFGRKAADGGSFPGVVYAVRMLGAVISAAMHFKLNLMILMLDLNSLYPRMLKALIFVAMLWLDIPYDMVEEFLAFNGDSEATVAKGGQLLDSCKYPIWGCFQGCSSSVKLMVIVTIMICQQVEDADGGFIFPWGELGEDVWWGHREHSTPGVAFADDIAAVAGGGWSYATRLSVEETERRMKGVGQSMLKVLHALGAPAGAAKTVLTGVLFDDDGERVFPEVQMIIFSEVGYATVRMVPLEVGLVHLGVVQEPVGDKGIFTAVLELEREASIMELMLDPDIPRKALMHIWFVSELGKWKYAAPKGDFTEKEAKRAKLMSSRVVRKLLKVAGLPNAGMYASVNDYGLGFVDPEEFLLRASAHSVMSLAKCEEGWMRAFFWFYLQATRVVNKIGVVDDPSNFVFFNWDVAAVTPNTITRWKWQNEFVVFLRVCRQRDLVVRLTDRAVEKKSAEWCVCGSEEAPQWIRDMDVLVKPAQVTKLMAVWYRKLQAGELQILAVAGELARMKHANRGLSNKWKGVGKVSLNVWLFMVKASFRLVPTPAWKCTRKLAEHAKCGLCGHVWCNLKHVLSCCEKMSSRLYSWRHQLVVKRVSKVLSKRWEIVSQEQDAVVKWLGRDFPLDSVHSRPDITLRNVVAGEGVVARILDVTVVYDEDANMINAALEKKRRYEPLRLVIEGGAGGGRALADVRVVPVVVGVLGTIPENWHETMAGLQVDGKTATKLAEDIHAEVVAASHWIWTRFCKSTYGEGGVECLVPWEK